MSKSRRQEPDIAKSENGEYLWGKIHVWVLHLGLSGAELATYVALRSWDSGSGTVWPSVKSIAARANLHPKTVEKAIQRLASDDIGLIVVEQRHRSDGSLTSCNYHLTDTPPRHLAGGYPSYGGEGYPRNGGEVPARRREQEETTEETSTEPDHGTDENSGLTTGTHAGPRGARGPQRPHKRKRRSATEVDRQLFADVLARNGEDLDDQAIDECYGDFARRWGAKYPGKWLEANETEGNLDGFLGSKGLWYEEDEIVDAQLKRLARMLLEDIGFKSTGRSAWPLADIAREIAPRSPLSGMERIIVALSRPYGAGDKTAEATQRINALRAEAAA